MHISSLISKLQILIFPYLFFIYFIFHFFLYFFLGALVIHTHFLTDIEAASNTSCSLPYSHPSCRTVMHLVVEGDREEIFRVLIEHDNLRLELQDKTGFPPLWHALAANTDFSDNSYASMLIKKGASPDAVSALATSPLLSASPSFAIN